MVNPVIGDAAVTALVSEPVEAGALSTTNAAMALDAKPQPETL
jgi:hypothetical protein